VDISEAIADIPVKYFYKDGTNDSNDKVGGDWRKLDSPDYASDYAFTRWMTYEKGVSPIPMSTFYDNSKAKNVKELKGTNLVRFAICKSDETINGVRERLIGKK